MVYMVALGKLLRAKLFKQVQENGNSHSMKIIGLIGEKGSGKAVIASAFKYIAVKDVEGFTADIAKDIIDTASDFDMHKSYKGRIVHEKFAWPIKNFIASMLACNAKDFDSQEQKNTLIQSVFGNVSIRKMHQQLADAVKNIVNDEKTFANAVYYRIQQNLVNGNLIGCKLIIIDDVRYEYEANIIRKLGGKLVRIVRNSAQKDDLHSSENSMQSIKADFVLDNNINLIDNFKHIKHIYDSIHNAFMQIYDIAPIELIRKLNKCIVAYNETCLSIRSKIRIVTSDTTLSDIQTLLLKMHCSAYVYVNNDTKLYECIVTYNGEVHKWVALNNIEQYAYVEAITKALDILYNNVVQ